MEKILMGGIVGFALLTLIAYILIVLNIPFLIIPFALLGGALIAKPFIEEVNQIKIRPDKKTIFVVILFTIGIIGQLLVISPSGIFQRGDLVFWSSNGHDGAWHIALMEEVKKGYPFQNPIFAGEKLVNYHFFSAILPSMVGRYTKISDQDLYFRIFPLIYSLFLGVSAFFLTKRLTQDFGASIWAVIFTYFAGSWGYIVTFIKNRTIGGESIFWATQPQSASGNPPQIVSDFLLLSALYYILLLTKKWSWLNTAILVLIAATLSEFKVYAGIVLFIGLGVASVYQLLKEGKPYFFFILLVSGLIAALLYFPNSTGSFGFLIFQPWWYIRTMIVDPGRLNWLDLELRREFYLARGGIRSTLRIVEYESIAFLIFFFGNIGMRFLGLLDFAKITKKMFSNYFNLTFVSIAIASLILPLLLLQKGVATNTSQFLQYLVLLLGITAGISTAKLTYKFKFLIPIILILMVPTQVGLLYEFYFRPAFAKISQQELTALSFIKSNTPVNDIVLTPPYDPNLNLGDTTPNIWDWFDTAYVSAFSARRTYFDDYEQVDIMGYDYRSRLAVKQTIFTSLDANIVKEKIKQTNAKLVYFPKAVHPKIDLASVGLTKIYENSSVEVWQIN